MNIPQLLQKRAKLGEDARALLTTATTEGRMTLTDEERTKYENMEVDIKGISDMIARERALSAAIGADTEERRLDTTPSTAFKSRLSEERARVEARKKQLSAPEFRDAFETYLRFGLSECSPEQIQVLQEVRSASPLSASTGTAGAYTIPQDFYNVLTDAMKWFGGMRAAGCTIINTGDGRTLPVPTSNDTSNVGELLAENTAAIQAVTEMVFGVVNLGAYKYSSKIVLVPIELLQDSAFDIQSFVAKKLGQRIGRITNTHFTVGTGSSQPKGVVVGSTSGVTGATGQTATVIYDDLVSLVHKVDPAYRAGAKWMFNDLMAAVIEKLKDGSGRPLLNSSLLGIANEIAAGKVDERKFLLGYEVVINNDIAAPAASAKSIVFGDFSTYFIREVMDIQLVRFQEKYMDAGQVGFLAFARQDGSTIDAGMHPLQYYSNSAT